MNVMKEVFIHRFLKTGGTAHHLGPCGSGQVAEEGGGEACPQAITGFSWEELGWGGRYPE
jgi:hypothetical protein